MNDSLFDEAIGYGYEMVRKFEVVLEQTLNHCVYNYIILCNAIYL
jgi:hypothetical protein